MSRRNHTAYMGSVSPGFEWTVEPHWDDHQGGVAQGAAGASLTFAAFRDTPFKFASFRDAQDDELHMSYQMPHGWDPTTTVKPHIHVIPLSAANGTVVLEGQYAWAQHGVELAANASWTTFRVEHAILASEANVLDIIPLATITPPATAMESDCLLLYLKRSGGDGSDNYAGNLAVVSVDAHFQRVKMGTLSEYPGA